MMRPAVVVVFVAAVLVLSAEGAPQQLAPSPAGKAPLSVGPTYDEIVVETQLAVRPKVAAGAGLNLRSARAKAVYFRPNATASASGVEVRRITPLAGVTRTTTSTTPSDGISFAARVVSDVNPLAEERARKAAAAARARRQSNYSGSSYSFHSSSSSGSGEQSGGAAPAAPLSLAPLAPGSGTSTSYSSGSSTHTVTRQNADGHIVTVSETDDFQSSLGPSDKAPVASRHHTVLVSGH